MGRKTNVWPVSLVLTPVFTHMHAQKKAEKLTYANKGAASHCFL